MFQIDKPLPAVTEEGAGYWEGCRQGELRGQLPDLLDANLAGLFNGLQDHQVGVLRRSHAVAALALATRRVLRILAKNQAGEPFREPVAPSSRGLVQQ